MTLLMYQATITPVRRVTKDHPLSWFQERMWLLNKKNPDDLSYNIPVVFYLEGALSIDALNKSINDILQRHETLRTRFSTTANGEPIQEIYSHVPFHLPVIDVDEHDIPRHIDENARHVFDLLQGPVFTGRLLTVGQNRHLLLLNVHHISADGWSVESILFSELQENYAAYSQGRIPSLTHLPIQYTDFARWQRQLDLTAGLDFWRRYLENYEASLELPADYLRTPHSGSTSERYDHSYTPGFSQALDTFAQAHGCTLFMALLAGFALTVQRYCGKKDLCIGTTTSGRLYPELEGLIGFFINILPLRIAVDEEMTVADFMNAVKTTALAGFEHQTVPFERIVYSSAVERSSPGSSLVPLVIRHQNFPRTRLEETLPGGVKFGPYPGYEGYRTATGKGVASRCEIELSYTGNRDDLDVEITYASDLYRQSTIERFLSHHEQLLREMMADDSRQLSALSMLTDADRRRLTIGYNRTDRPIDLQPDFVDRFNLQARTTPDAVACIDTFGSWSYRQIAAAADSLAATLASHTIGKGDIVGVCLERSAPLLSAFLAVWKTGAAYVPLDPGYPQSYLHLIMDDAQPRLVICTEVERKKLELSEDSCCIIPAKLPDIADTPVVSPQRRSPEDAAYIMYTSGSTGTPKGVLIPHSQLINWLGGIEATWPFQPGEMIAQKTTIAFAVSVKEIFAGLLNGTPLTFIPTDTVKDPTLFVKALRSCEATRVNLVPSHLQSVLAHCTRENISLPKLRICITAGEPLTAELVTSFTARFPHTRLVNNWGCTELNDIAYYDTDQFDGTQGFVPIGRPIQNTKLYILDRRGRLVPEGVPGEAHVATAGMALGYLHLDDLNRERFIANPFSSDHGGLLYNTGDVVRYLSDGNLEFLGRWDFQVKIRGFRVDVRHVEKIMGEYDGMGVRAVVGEHGQLLAFYVEQPGSPVDVEHLRRFLEQRLPPYMVPTAYIGLPEMPKLPNGKLNRRALTVSAGTLRQSSEFIPLETDTERRLAELWSEVLDFPEDRIGRHAQFFELGGHSLSATRLIARVKERFGVEIGLSQFFEHHRLDELAEIISAAAKPADADDDVLFLSMARPVVRHRAAITHGLLEDKVVLVTGGSRGIGRAAVRLLARHGASVAINYLRSDDHARMVNDIIIEDGGVSDIFKADTTDPQQVKDLVGSIEKKFGKIDVVVANAAIGFKITPFISGTWNDFERKLTDELKSLYLLCQEVVPGMMERHSGSIIAVSSTMSKLAQPGYSAHGAAKAALDAFVRSLAIELGPEGIRINTVAPGLTLTDATAAMPQTIRDTASARCPLRRNGLPRDVAGAILFLASDMSQFMTGTYLPVDGGYTML